MFAQFRHVSAKFWGKSEVADQGSQHVANSKQIRDSQSLGIACGGFLGASRASFFHPSMASAQEVKQIN